MEAWVRVEIESHRVVGGHHYLNVLEKTPGGEIAAKASAKIWRSRASIVDNFTRVTGKGLDPGMSVVVRVTVDYHAQYGLSLIITDLDAGYSIGLRELERKETIRKLDEAGLLVRQKSLLLPYLPSSIAVISSRDAAGYGDFMRHLEGNPYGYRFNCTLFQSLMQGENAPSSIMDALDDIRGVEGIDLVVILRGGGADSDMFCFDDYGLCKAIAQFPLPVFTAIGHERDHHVADMVAHTYLKTPTALSDALVEWVKDVESTVDDALLRVQNALRQRLTAADTLIASRLAGIKYHLSDRINAMSVERTVSTIRFALSSRLSLWDSRIALLEASIKSSDPRGILSQGYVLAVGKDGTVLKNLHAKSVGDDFFVRFSDGLWDCSINEIKETPKQ